MSLGRPIQIRLNLEKQVLYEDAAARLGITLAAFIRERLNLADQVHLEIETTRTELSAEIAAVRRDIAAVQHGLERRNVNGAGQSTPTDNTLLVELLLLLRASAAPDRMAMIHAELQRLGLSVWTYNSGRP